MALFILVSSDQGTVVCMLDIDTSSTPFARCLGIHSLFLVIGPQKSTEFIIFPAAIGSPQEPPSYLELVRMKAVIFH